MFELVNKDGVFLLKSTVLKSKHGFSTRIGGISELEHTKGLNLAFGRGDNDDFVFKNLSLFADAVGFDDKMLISVPQIHSNIVRYVDLSDTGSGYYKKSDFSCDGYITDKVGLAIGVKTADCVPILIEARDDDQNVIAVSAVHAGWRGTADKILKNAIDEFLKLGAKIENIYVAIGPCIDVCCYEVWNDFVEQIETKLGQNYVNKFITKVENGSRFANLKGMNAYLLLEAGVLKNNIDVCEKCTCCEDTLFYSHRRQKGIRGAHLSVIVK